MSVTVYNLELKTQIEHLSPDNIEFSEGPFRSIIAGALTQGIVTLLEIKHGDFTYRELKNAVAACNPALTVNVDATGMSHEELCDRLKSFSQLRSA